MKPFRMLGNFGTEIPTIKSHDMSGIVINEIYQIISLSKKDMQSQLITLVVSGPKYIVLYLYAETKNHSELEKLSV